MAKSLQTITEEKVYEILFELENELNIETKQLPEVYYVGRNFNFEKVGINRKAYSNFPNFRKEKAANLTQSQIIFTNIIDDKVLAEEAGHFIHERYIRYSQNALDEFGAGCIREMVGFFSSKLIDPKRENDYEGDLFLNKQDIFEIAKVYSKEVSIGGYEDLIHQQGYSLGEKLYNKFISGQMSKKDIQKIIKKEYPGKLDAFFGFFKLKNEILK